MQIIFNFKDEPKFCSGWSTWPSEARPAHIFVNFVRHAQRAAKNFEDFSVYFVR